MMDQEKLQRFMKAWWAIEKPVVEAIWDRGEAVLTVRPSALAEARADRLSQERRERRKLRKAAAKR